jgi:type IV fimbrial biogenesis protein FimT
MKKPALRCGRDPRQAVRRARGEREAAGFTLIEMLVGLSIMSLVGALALPSVRTMIDSAQLIAASNGFVSSLQLARSEAIKRQDRVVLCKTADGIMCASTGGWEQGWIIFRDANNNGLREAAEPILHRQLALPGTLRLTGNANVAAYVAFVPTGGTRLIGGGFQAGTLTLCHQSLTSRDARQIILNAAGRPRVHRGPLPSCL